MSILDGWHWCPRCKGPLEKARGAALCPACGFVMYANSAPTASALVVDDGGRVLLARRAGDPFRDLWDIPGGFLEEGEHPEDALRRELLEETGLEVEPTGYLGVWMDQYGDGLGAPATLNLVWTARVVGGEERPDDDVAELAWFGRDELPPRGELAFATVAAVLDAWRHQHP
jgi:ADP-ribose pyrophosphatase YjhB (NUDIX family)